MKDEAGRRAAVRLFANIQGTVIVRRAQIERRMPM
jgi:hypothetical protein